MIVNFIWHILQDPPSIQTPWSSNVHPRTIPQRELREGPSPIAFAFCRRVCPGINMANSPVFIGIADPGSLQ